MADGHSGIKMVFFDAGGTLIRTAQPVGYYYALTASHYGVHANADELQSGFVKAWKEMKPRDPVQGARVTDDRMWWKDLVRRSWGTGGFSEEAVFDAYFDEVYDLFARPEVWRIYPDAVPVLERLRGGGMRCAVLSNWDRRLHLILQGLGLGPYFEHVIISSEVGAEKPHPHIFEKSLALARISPPEALLIGDDEYFDGQGAENAGWKAVLVRRPEIDLADALENFGLLQAV